MSKQVWWLGGITTAFNDHSLVAAKLTAEVSADKATGQAVLERLRPKMSAGDETVDIKQMHSIMDNQPL